MEREDWWKEASCLFNNQWSLMVLQKIEIELQDADSYSSLLPADGTLATSITCWSEVLKLHSPV